MNKLLSSGLILSVSLTGIGFFSNSAQAACNVFGCSQSTVADCNPFGCPNAPMGRECTPFGCPASPQPQTQSQSSNNNSSSNTTLSDFQFCVEQYKEEGYSTSSAMRRCQDFR